MPPTCPTCWCASCSHEFVIPQAAIRVWGGAEAFAGAGRSPAASSDDVQELRRQPRRAVLRRQRRLRRGAVAGRAGAGAVDRADPAAPRRASPAPSACWCSPRPTRPATPPTWAPTSWRASARSRAPALDAAAADELMRKAQRSPTIRRRRATPTSPAISQHLAVERRLAARTLALYGEALRPPAALRRSPRRCRCARRRRTTSAAGRRSCTAPAWRRAASRSRSRPGAASTAGSAAKAWSPPTRCEGVRAPKAAQPLPKALSVDDAVALVGASRRRRRRRRWPRATPASSSCSTAAACASASWSGSTSSPAPTPRGWIDCRRRQRARPRQGQQAAQRAGRQRGAGGARGLAGAARRRWRAPGEPALFVSRRGTRLTREPGALAPEGAGASPPACRRTCIRTCCATRSPRTCCSRAATCARCRSCSATPTSRRRRSTPSSTSATCRRSTTPRIRGRRSAS